MLITVFDSETTGLSTSQILNPEFWPYIVQFSYIVYDTKKMKIVEIKDSIITAKLLAVYFDEAAKRLHDFLGTCK